MAKKLSLLLATAAVLAFAVPAFASAATGLTEKGVLVATPKIVTFTNIGAMKITSTKLGVLECEHMMLEANLTVNTAAEVRATEGGTQSATTCIRAGTSFSVKNIELHELKTTGGGAGTVSFAFDIEVSKTLTCHLVGTGDTFTYNSTETSEGGDVITISSAAMTVTPAACGTTSSLDLVLTTTTQNTTTPIYLM